MKFRDYLDSIPDRMCRYIDSTNFEKYCKLPAFHTGNHKITAMCYLTEPKTGYFCTLPKNHHGKHLATTFGELFGKFVFNKRLIEWEYK